MEALLPLSVQEKIDAYSSRNDRMLRLAGKWLLGQLLENRNHRPVTTLSQLIYNEWGKPYFPGANVQFSIAHSGTLAICAMAERKRAIGVDVEWMKPVALADVEDYLTTAERASIKEAAEPTTRFYELWTRKEAMLKASGKGIGTPFSYVEALDYPAHFEDHKWFWHHVNILPGYMVHLATANDAEEIIIKEIQFPA